MHLQHSNLRSRFKKAKGDSASNRNNQTLRHHAKDSTYNPDSLPQFTSDNEPKSISMTTVNLQENGRDVKR